MGAAWTFGAPPVVAGLGWTAGAALGAAWGALLLLRIAASGSFVSISLQEVNAHGHAQIFGWIGLFVMGLICYLRLGV